MGTPHRPDPDRRDPVDMPVDPGAPDHEQPAPFEFIERPRVERDVYISRPELGRDPGESRADRTRRPPS